MADTYNIIDHVNPRIVWHRYGWVEYVAVVTLTQQERAQAENIGRAIDQASKVKGDREKKFSKDGELIHIQGAMCEMAVCLLLGFPHQSNEGTYRKSDLPYGIEVKGHTRADYDCRVKPDEPNDHKIVMCIQEAIYKPIWIIGWIRAKDAKKCKLGTFGKRHSPNHRVPKSRLRRLWPLRKWVMQKEGRWNSEWDKEEPIL